MLIFLLIVVIGIVLWFGIGLYNDASLEHLKQTGFQVDYTLQGSPPVVFDNIHKKLAFLKLTGVFVYDYDQVLRWEWGTQEQSGWNNKSESIEKPYLVFYLRDQNDPVIRIYGFDEAEFKSWRERLPALLPQAPPEKP
jgi:hypothetical protein